MDSKIYRKKIVLGKYPINGRMIATAEVDFELKRLSDGFVVFSMCGNVHNTAHPHCWYFGGQCIEELARHFHTEQMAEMYGIWKRWHLNDLHTGCEHQRDFEKEPYEKHALEVCPVCGHKYGSDWQREELPQEVIDMIKSW